MMLNEFFGVRFQPSLLRKVFSREEKKIVQMDRSLREDEMPLPLNFNAMSMNLNEKNE